MRRTTSLLVCLASLHFVAIGSASEDTPGPQTFRSGVELLQLDVSVLDKARRPVADLKAGDFTVLVDGKPHPVVAFKAVTAPPPPPASSRTGWTRDVAPDVVSNLPTSGRVVAILIDDYSFAEAGIGPGGLQKARQIALAAVDQLGPDDRAAVLFTGNAHTAQGFTTDRQLLTRAIETSALSTGEAVSPADAAQSGQCYCGACPMEALTNVAQALRALPEQRKIVLYVSAGSAVLIPRSNPNVHSVQQDLCTPIKRDATHDALRMAQLANVTVESVDPKGLTMGRLSTGANGRLPNTQTSVDLLEDPPTLRLQFLRTLAESTGGRAVVNNNDMELEVPSLLSESRGYYLLGVEPSARVEDGRFHDVRVRVNRRDVEVRARSGYYDSTEKQRAAAAAARVANSAGVAIAGAMPLTGMPLDVTVAPFAMTDGQPTVVVTLGVRPAPTDDRRAVPRSDVVSVVAELFNPESGERIGERAHQLHVDWGATDVAGGRYEVFSGVPVRPGRYEVRVGVSTDGGPDASVYTYVDVPNFADEAFSLSGLVLEASPALRSAPADEFAGLLPLTPTARRSFLRTDHVSALLRVYQLKANTFAATTVTIRITDATNVVVSEQPATVGGDGRREADHRMELPLERLASGEYLLTVDATAGGRQARRSLRFTVQ